MAAPAEPASGENQGIGRHARPAGGDERLGRVDPGGLVRALAAVEQIGGEPQSAHVDWANQLALADSNGMLELVSERAVAASAAGLEAIAVLAEAGGTANPAAARLLADTIRDALDEMGALLSL